MREKIFKREKNPGHQFLISYQNFFVFDQLLYNPPVR